MVKVKTMSKTWSPAGWRNLPAIQMPTYKDKAAVEAVEAQLSGYPPLVFAGEARALKAQLGERERGPSRRVAPR